MQMANIVVVQTQKGLYIKPGHHVGDKLDMSVQANHHKYKPGQPSVIARQKWDMDVLKHGPVGCIVGPEESLLRHGPERFKNMTGVNGWNKGQVTMDFFLMMMRNGVKGYYARTTVNGVKTLRGYDIWPGTNTPKEKLGGGEKPDGDAIPFIPLNETTAGVNTLVPGTPQQNKDKVIISTFQRHSTRISFLYFRFA